MKVNLHKSQQKIVILERYSVQWSTHQIRETKDNTEPNAFRVLQLMQAHSNPLMTHE